MKRLKNGIIVFEDYPDFRPNITPQEMFQQGAFGGTYWRPIYSSITKKNYKDQHLEFENWWKGIPINHLTSCICDKSINKFKEVSGSSLDMWEKKNWIKPQDPYGWVQWYCRFYAGRRSPDDERQIKRWLNYTGPKGRFKRNLINQIKKKKTSYNDETVSPVIRQGLHQWAYELMPDDLK